MTWLEKPFGRVEFLKTILALAPVLTPQPQSLPLTQERSPAIDIGTDAPSHVRGESTPLEPLIRKLERFGALSDEEKRVVTSAVTRTRTLSPYEDLTTNGQQGTHTRYVLRHAVPRSLVR